MLGTASVAGRILLGLALFAVLVFQPLRANLLASVAVAIPMDSKSRAAILDKAADIDKCQLPILDSLGDAHASYSNFPMAAMAYGRAMACSPASPIARFKYGEMLLAMGYIEGYGFVEQALILEPGNPLFAAEYQRLTALIRAHQQR